MIGFAAPYATPDGSVFLKQPSAFWKRDSVAARLVKNTSVASLCGCSTQGEYPRVATRTPPVETGSASSAAEKNLLAREPIRRLSEPRIQVTINKVSGDE